MSETVASDEHVCPGEVGPNQRDRMELITSTSNRPAGFVKACTTCGQKITVRRPDRIRPYWAPV